MEISSTRFRDMFKVRSDSGNIYQVDLDTITCSCPDWAIQRNKRIGAARQAGQPDSSVTYECKHIKAVKTSVGLEKTVNSLEARRERAVRKRFREIKSRNTK